MKYELCDDDDITDFEATKRIRLGKGRHYCVYRNESPYVSVEVDYHSCFSEAVVFHEFLLIGNYVEGLSIVHLTDLSVEKRDIKGYFGYFEITDDVLYVLGCHYVYAYDSNMNEIWVSDFLAYDGIICKRIEGNIMYLSCEMDPPGGWVDKKIDVITGAVLQ